MKPINWPGQTLDAVLRANPALASDCHLEPDEDRTYAVFQEHGISLVLLDHVSVKTVQLFSAGHEDMDGYGLPLPAGLGFEMSRADVRARLGQPAEQGQRQYFSDLGEKGGWDAYLIDRIRIHLAYVPDESRIELVSLSANPSH
jgi:hypothetical protein